MKNRQEDANIPTAIVSTVTPDTSRSNMGRPKYLISENTLVHFKELGFPWKEIADLLLVSRWTILRRVKEYGLQEILGYSKVSDDELDIIILDYRKNMAFHVANL